MNAKTIFISLLIFPLLHTSAQVHYEIEKINIDSLEQILPGLTGTEKIDALNKMALALCRDYPDSCIKMSDRAKVNANKIDYLKGLADASLYKGTAYFYLDSLKPTVINYLEALRIYEELEPCVEMGFVLRMLQSINFFTGRLEKAKNYGRRASHILASLKDYDYQCRSLITLGLISTEIDEFDSANFFLNSALNILNKYPNSRLKSLACFDKAYSYHRQYIATRSKYAMQDAIFWYLKTINSDTVSKAIESLAYNNLGQLYTLINNNDSIQQGIEYILHSQRIVYTLKTRAHIIQATFQNLAAVEFHQDHYNKAIKLLQRGIAEGKKRMSEFSIINYSDPLYIVLEKYYYMGNLVEIYSQLYDFYILKGDSAKALSCYVLMEKSAEKFFGEKTRNLISVLEADSENEKTEKQIAFLERDNELKEMRVTQSRMFNIGITILFVFLILVGLLFLRQNKLKNEYKSTLLEQKLLRLQMNPHFIFNAFSNILKFIDSNENRKASEYLTTFSKLLRTTLESTREDLVPFEKEVGALRNYLDLQKLRYPDKFDYTVEVDEEIDEEDMSIPPMLVQPFIENAIEHGIRHKKEKGRIDVRFTLEGKTILCEVEDDGVGREKAREAEYSERPGHKSLATEIIRDRIKVLNKKFKQKIQLEIIDKRSETKEATGTKVMIDLPWGSVY